MTDQDVRVKYSVDGVPEATKNASKLQTAWEKLSTVSKVLLGGAIAALAKGLYDCVKAFGESESATEGLKSALRSTGQEVDRNSENLNEFANNMQRLTTIEDDVAVGLLKTAINMGLNADEAEKATRNAIGLNAAYGVDLAAGLKMATAAGEGNFALLQRTIPTLRGITDQTQLAAEAQRLMAAGFQQAQDKTKTFEGSMLQLKNSINSAQEVIGGLLAPALTFIASGISGVVTWFTSLGSSVQTVMVSFGILSAIIGVMIPLWGSLGLAVWAALWPILAVVGAIVALGAAVFFIANAMAPLTEKTKQLAKEHENLEEKAKSLKENGSEYLKLQNELQKTNGELTKNEEKLRENIKALNDQRIAIEEKIAAQQKDVEKAQKTKGNEDDINELAKLEDLEKQKTAIMAAAEDARRAMLAGKTVTKHQTIADLELSDVETKQAVEDEQKTLKDDQDAIELEKFLADKQFKSDAELQKEGYTVTQIKAIRSLAEKENQKRGADYIALIGKNADTEKDLGKAVAQGSLDYAKQAAIGAIDAKAAEMAGIGMGLIATIIGIPLGLLYLAGAGVVAAAGHSLIGQVKLAEGGSMIVDQPTQIGGNVIAGEAGPERIDVTPLGQSQPITVNNAIYLDGELITTQVVKTSRAMESEGIL